MESSDWTCIAAAFLAYVSIFSCRCYQKTKTMAIVAWCLFGAAIAPFLLKDRFDLTVFYVGFVLGLLGYFEFCYEGRLSEFGHTANDVREIPQQLYMLSYFALKIEVLLLRRDFYFYSPEIGKNSLAAFAGQHIPVAGKEINEAFCHALRFVRDGIAEKGGEPSRGHSLSLLVERINRNVLLYLLTSRVGNMADIRDAAKQNLKCLLAIYYCDFHLNGAQEAYFKTAEAFSNLHRKFENTLEKFPVRLELA